MGTKTIRPRTLWLVPVILLFLGLVWWREIIRVNHYPDHTTVKIVFLVPMDPGDLESKLHLVAEQPMVIPDYKGRWLNPFTLVVEIREPERFQGQQLTVRIDRAATRIPFLKKSATVTVRRPIRPELYRVDPVVPSTGPLKICFNTPLQPKSVMGNILVTLDGKAVDGKLEPRRIPVGGSVLEDRATWLFRPTKQLPHDTDLELVIRGGLTSAGGLAMNSEARRTVRTAPELQVVRTKPSHDAIGVDLHPEIQAEFNQSLSWGWMDMDGIQGRVEVWANHIQFTPLEPLMPDREYTVHIRAISRLGEQARTDLRFKTLTLGNKMWVAVDLEGEHNVTIYRGSEVVRVFKASGGKVTSPTPLGTYFLYNRGYAFWNQRLQEGAYYWVQFSGPYLVHSVPFDDSGKLKQEELGKLGQAASHGCIRLSLEDAKWFFHHVPNGTMIVIYNQH